MPYIGNTPALDYISYAVQNFTVTAGTTSYSLDYSVANENDIRLVINNVIQRPGVSYAYSATGTTLTLTSATLVTDTMYAVFIGRAVQTVTPPANINIQLADGSASAPSLNFANDTNTGIFRPTTDEIALTEGGVEGMRLNASGNVQFAKNISVGGATPTTSGSGITFPATQSASTDANTLDDYEEGTFTPTILGTTTAGTFTPNGSYTYGRYTKIGRIVNIYFGLVYSSFTGTGFIRCGGLPFTSQNEYTYLPIMTAGANLAKPANTIVIGIMQANNNFFEPVTYSTSGTDLTVSNLAVDASAELFFNFFYNV